MKIHNIKAKQIKNSRNEKTLWVAVIGENGAKGIASVPSGASKGNKEAVERRDANYSVQSNIEIIEKKIEPVLRNIEAEKQEIIDEILVELDASKNKSNFGANTILAVSLACARLGAKSKSIELWKHIASIGGFSIESKRKINLFFNMIEGGKHANNNLDFQEYLIVPKTHTIKKSLNLAKDFYKKLGNDLNKRFGNVKLGDEKAYAPEFKPFDKLLYFFQKLIARNNAMDIIDEKPIKILSKAISGMPIRIALDIAGNSFYDKNSKNYILGNSEYSKKKYYELVKSIIQKYSIFSVEDPFYEEFWSSFADLHQALPNTLIVGDDLTVTNESLILKAVNKKAINAVIIKPNQIGTLSETLQAIKFAQSHNLKVIISHRSGETKDSFIADLAWACNAFGLKSGAPFGEERLSKYNRLVAIEQSQMSL